MPLVPLDTLPADARTWVFGASRTLSVDESRRLLEEVDPWLARWSAHGMPLTVGRTMMENRFLVVAVDQRDAHASGCSIDGLFRHLQELERILDASLVGSARVYWRAAEGIRSADRSAFAAAAQRGEVGPETRVFDPTVSTLGEWRDGFEKVARESWHSAFMKR